MEKYTDAVEAVLADLHGRKIVKRMWRHDHTVWKPEPAEITNRLGWLKVIDLMREHLFDLDAFAREVRNTGFRHIVLLGMGGSSLGAEVLRQVLGSANGYPELIVLDSTLPASVRSVVDSINLSRTLFLVSSKSGTTTEPLALYYYFHRLVEPVVERGKAGQNFVAITDPGTPLVAFAEENGFRRIFMNPSDIGGRYSVLSYFGLVPAVLTGINVMQLLDRADAMRQECSPTVATGDNPGAWLGAYLGALEIRGRDKLTLITSPALGSFGLWVEQLIAESTGKEGKGIVPVVGEPLVAVKHYGADRLFVYLRLDGDDNVAVDTAVARIEAAEQPVLTLALRDRYDLGAEFFRWEFATAIAGVILGINPFDQPDVQAAKDATESLLHKYVTIGYLPRLETIGSLADLLAKAGRGKYLAIMAYLTPTPETDRALADLRQRVVERYGMATTLGYGPRFLHSTGQLHKGGADNGLFLQITGEHEMALSIPGKSYTFGVVADAQALGDFEALQTLKRDIVRIHFRRSDGATIASELVGRLTK